MKKNRKLLQTLFVLLTGVVIACLGGVKAGAWADTTYAESSSDNLARVADYEWELTKTGSFSAVKDSEMEFYDEQARIRTGSGFQLVGENGKPLMDGKVFDEIENCGDGIYAVGVKDGDKTLWGLVDMDGTVLYPCEAYGIKDGVSGNGFTSSRFLMLATDLSTSQVTARFFDLHKKSLISGLAINVSASESKSTDTFEDMGDSFALKVGVTTTIYSAEGKKLWSKEGDFISPNERFVNWRQDGKSQIVDAGGKERYISKNYIRAMSDNHASWQGADYALEEEGSGSSPTYRVIDLDGNDVLGVSLEKAPKYTNGLFVVDENGKRYAVTPAGKHVAELKSDKSIDAVIPGYNVFVTKDGSDSIAKGDKVISQDGDGKIRHLVSEGTNGMYLVLNDETYSMRLEEPTELGTGLVVDRKANDMTYGLYDLFTGKQLLSNEFNEIKYAGDRVFARTDNTWTVYKADLSET